MYSSQIGLTEDPVRAIVAWMIIATGAMSVNSIVRQSWVGISKSGKWNPGRRLYEYLSSRGLRKR
jgi:hypothetical protein